MIYLELFWSFFQIGLMSIGGGYAALPLIQQQVIVIHPWITAEDFTNLITLAEMTPGPIAINAATFVGTQVGGIWGGLTATAAFLTAPLIIVLFLAFLFKKYQNLSAVQGVMSGLRPAVVSLIASAGLSILLIALFEKGLSENIDLIQTAIFAASIFALRKFKKLNPVFVILGAGAIGAAVYLTGLI
jgi:chromate transporter